MRAAVLLLASCAAALAAHMPAYNIDTLPVFFHSANSSGPFNDAAIAEIAKFSMATVEKFQGTCWQEKDDPSCNQVEVILAQLKRIKAANPNISTIIYFNSVLDFHQYELHQLLIDNPSYRSTTSAGKTIVMPGDHIKDAWAFNWLSAGMIGAILKACTDPVNSGAADGCFMDRSIDGIPHFPNATHAAQWQAAHVAGLQGIQDAMSDGDGILIANHGYTLPKLNAVMIETFGPGASSLTELNESVSAGKLVQAHSAGCCTPGCDAKRNASLALFLTLMPGSNDPRGSRAYWGCGPWLNSGSTLPENGWQDDFDYPLGEPLGAATISNGVMTRHFASGTVAVYDTTTHTGDVTWARH